MCVTAPLVPAATRLSARGQLVVAARSESYEKCADQPVTAKNRRLTHTTEPSILRLA
jgi:hypothetical protein